MILSKDGKGGILPFDNFNLYPSRRYELSQEYEDEHATRIAEEILDSVSEQICSLETADLALKNLSADVEFLQEVTSQKMQMAELIRAGILAKKAEIINTPSTRDCIFIDKNISGQYSHFYHPNHKVVVIAHLKFTPTTPPRSIIGGNPCYEINSETDIHIANDCCVEVFVSRSDIAVAKRLLSMSKQCGNAPIWDASAKKDITSLAIPGDPWPAFIDVSIQGRYYPGMHELSSWVTRDQAKVKKMEVYDL